MTDKGKKIVELPDEPVPETPEPQPSTSASAQAPPKPREQQVQLTPEMRAVMLVLLRYSYPITAAHIIHVCKQDQLADLEEKTANQMLSNAYIQGLVKPFDCTPTLWAAVRDQK